MAELVSAFGLIVLYIWSIRGVWPLAFIAILGLIVLSNRLRGETAHCVGLCWPRFRGNLRRFAAPLVATVSVVLAVGFLAGSVRPVTWRIAAGVVAYCVWGLVQQYILNGFFVNRLTAAGSPGVPVLAGTIFGALHFPNPFLIVVTFAAGVVASMVYLRHRDLLLLAVAHGVIGTALYVAVPDTVSHGLRVGAGCVRFCEQAKHTKHLSFWLDPTLLTK